MEEVLLFNKFFPLSIHASIAKTQPAKLCDGAQMAIFGDFLHPVFSASRKQYVSDLHSKFALRHTMCGSMVDIQSATDEIRRRKKRRKKEETGQKYNVRICYAGRP